MGNANPCKLDLFDAALHGKCNVILMDKFTIKDDFAEITLDRLHVGNLESCCSK